MQQEDNLGYTKNMNRSNDTYGRDAFDGGFTGFSHGAYTSNQRAMGGYADRHPRRANIAQINTTSFAQSPTQNPNDLTAPGTAFDMNFLPHNLLSSPLQPGTPSTFASPSMNNLSNFQQNQQNFSGSPIQASGMSPDMYQNMMSQNMGAQQFMVPQSPTGMGFGAQQFGTPVQQMQMSGAMNSGSRTVYLGNIPPETSAEEILGHVRSGQIESVRLLPDKNCAFISFLDGGSATHFHSDAILKKLAIRGQDIKIGWGKPAQVPTSVALAVQQSGASRNVYLGNLPDTISEAELREDLGKFGPIDTVKLVREKAIGFVHFMSISNAMKAVAQLPQEPKWQAPRRVYYGKDRCAYVSKTQQQNAAQYLGIAPGYAHVLNGADRDLISSALAQQSVAAAAVATTAGGVSNLGNRTVYLGNIHPETTIEEICNVVRGGLLHHIRYIPDKHICFVTFIDPTSAASFYALSNIQGLMIHNRRLKIGWGKHSGALPPAIALAVSGGASRNVYIGNLDESWTEERLRQDFAEYGDIELVNTLREKSCAFVNFTNIANAIKAIEAIRGREEYSRFKVNFGKDRCGNAPRQNNNAHHNQQQQQNQQQVNGVLPDGMTNGNVNHQARGSANISPTRHMMSSGPDSTSNSSQTGQSAALNGSHQTPLNMFLNQINIQQAQVDQELQQQQAAQQAQQQHHAQQQQAMNDPFTTFSTLGSQQSQRNGFGGNNNNAQFNSTMDSLSTSMSLLDTAPSAPSANAFSSSHLNGLTNGISTTSSGSGAPLINGLLAPIRSSQHTRAVSLPAFTQPEVNGHSSSSSSNAQMGQGQGLGGGAGRLGGLAAPSQAHHGRQQSSFAGLGSGFGGFGSVQWGLPIWNEEAR